MSWSCLVLLLYWLEALALHALFAYEEWRMVKPRCMTPEREEAKKAWFQEYNEVYLCGWSVHDAMCGTQPKSYWCTRRLCAEALVREERKEVCND